VLAPSLFRSCPQARAFPETIPKANALQNPCSNRQEYAEESPHFTASELAVVASSLPLPRILPIPVSSACASFASIRNNVSVIRPLRTLSTHRIVRSTNPLSIRSNALYQTRLLNPRVFIPIKTSRVIGPSTNFFEKEPGAQSGFPGETYYPHNSLRRL